MSKTGGMAVIENSKVTIVGAGSVGSSTAYAALIRGSARHVALYDIATEKVEAEVLDLAHGTQFTGSSDIIGGSNLSVVEGSHVVVITAGAKQSFLDGADWAYTAGIVAILLGATLVFFLFPRKQQEDELLAGYQREDATA